MSKKNNKRGNVFSLMRKITDESKSEESFNTGLIGEHIIISSYKQMKISDLEKMRFIINKIIKKKKEMKRVSESKP